MAFAIIGTILGRTQHDDEPNIRRNNITKSELDPGWHDEFTLAGTRLGKVHDREYNPEQPDDGFTIASTTQ